MSKFEELYESIVTEDRENKNLKGLTPSVEDCMEKRCQSLCSRRSAASSMK